MQEPALTNAVQAKDFQQSVNLVVGGIYYSLSVADIARYPESYFAHLVQPHWTKDSTAVMKIDRNGEIFRYISSFIFYGQFEPPHRPIQDLETLLSVREEADFYNLPDLIHKCDSGITEWIKEWCRQQLSHAGVFSLYGCVQDTREKSTDALLNAVHLIRPPCIATAMTTTLSEVAIPIPTWSRTYYENIPGSAHYNCIQPIGDFVEYSHLINICEPFAVCPFTGNKLKPRPADCRRLDVEVLLLYYSYFEGGYCTKRTPGWYCESKIGTVVCILHSKHTGGRVTAQINGKTVSIERPGECMALRIGCSYTVEEVTSGTLTIVEFDMEPRESKEQGELTLPWTLHRSVSCNNENEVYSKVLTAIACELENYERVVLCLANFYPIVSSLNASRQFKTADNMLSESDAQLHLLLAQYYDVDIVTVAITVSSDYTTVVSACVLDYLSTTFTSDSTGGKNKIADATFDTVQKSDTKTCAKYKIVAPLYGYGEKFSYEKNPESQCHRGMLLTALMLTRKE